VLFGGGLLYMLLCWGKSYVPFGGGALYIVCTGGPLFALPCGG
jgi:hypothetical protein